MVDRRLVMTPAQKQQKRCAVHGADVYLDPVTGRLFCSKGAEYLSDKPNGRDSGATVSSVGERAAKDISNFAVRNPVAEGSVAAYPVRLRDVIILGFVIGVVFGTIILFWALGYR